MHNDLHISPMTATEKRATISLASIYALRMLGLFMILPVFTLYAEHLNHVTPFLIGLAISAYGLTQALFQIPFGLLSDRIGRKPVIISGLILFAVGSVIAAVADSIYIVILGRTIQGSGAIAAVVMAMAADLTREEQRTKIMALIGMSIGASFMIALVMGPILSAAVGVDGIFWLTAILAVAGIPVVAFILPQPVRGRVHRDAQPVPAQFSEVLSQKELLRLDYGIFSLHLILTASFVVIPLVLRDHAHIEAAQHAWVYFPVLLASVIAMVPFIIIAEKKKKMKMIFLLAISGLGLANLSLFYFYQTLTGVLISLFIYFTAFNLLEATLPSLMSKMAPSDSKGTAMGVYSTAQFMGAFCGGILGGWIYGTWGLQYVFLFDLMVILGWLLIASGMSNPVSLSSYILSVGEVKEEQAASLVQALSDIKGVAEAVVVVEDGIAYLKVNKKELDHEMLESFMVPREISV